MERNRSGEFEYEFLIACTAPGNARSNKWDYGCTKFGLDGILDTLKYLEPWMTEKLDKYNKEQKEMEERMKDKTK